MIPDACEQLDPFRTGAVIRAIINDEHRFALLAGQSIEDTEQPSAQQKQQTPPVVGLTLQQLVGGVFAERQFAVENDAAEEVLADKGQCENGFCQRAHAMAVMFTHPATVHQGSNLETAKEVINFALNVNVGLRLGGDPGMVHLSPFHLILL